MSALTGREMVAAAALASTWNTAVACGAGDGILLTSLGLKQNIDLLKDESFGITHIKRSDQGRIAVAGSIGGYMRYEGLDLLLALVMGAAGTPTQQGATAAYAYAYALADNIDGLFATIAVLKTSDKVFEYPSCKVHGFRIGGAMNESLVATFDIAADQEVLDSATNTSATMANVTYPDAVNRILLTKAQSFYCRINDASGDALDSGDNCGISSFELSYNRPPETLYDFLVTGGAEPSQQTHAAAQLTVNFNRLDDANFPLFEDWSDGTAKKIEFSFTGPLIASTYYYLFKIQIPNALVIDADGTPTGPGRIPAKLTFDLRGCDAAPTGMTGITTPFKLSGINKRTTDPLA